MLKPVEKMIQKCLNMSVQAMVKPMATEVAWYYRNLLYSFTQNLASPSFSFQLAFVKEPAPR
jgi:hypothetical protein